jgi:hypothetical protein
MKTTVVPVLAIVTAALLLTACAEDGRPFWHHHHHDHDGDHLVGAQTRPSGPAGSVAVGR